MELEYDKALLALHPLWDQRLRSPLRPVGGIKSEDPLGGTSPPSWIAWVIGIIATLGSFRTSVLANQDALEKRDSGEHPEANPESVLADRLTTILNWSSGVLFVAG
jgi:hypothetical protein